MALPDLYRYAMLNQNLTRTKRIYYPFTCQSIGDMDCNHLYTWKLDKVKTTF